MNTSFIFSVRSLGGARARGRELGEPEEAPDQELRLRGPRLAHRAREDGHEPRLPSAETLALEGSKRWKRFGRANLTGLVLGCIEAKFCKKIFV